MGRPKYLLLPSLTPNDITYIHVKVINPCHLNNKNNETMIVIICLNVLNTICPLGNFDVGFDENITSYVLR